MGPLLGRQEESPGRRPLEEPLAVGGWPGRPTRGVRDISSHPHRPGVGEFDRAAASYDRSRRPPSEGELKAVVNALEGCRSVLDVGTGTGRYALPLERHGFTVKGMDLSRPMLHVARAKGLYELLQADAFRLPLREGSMDGSVAVHVLQLVSDPVAVLREMGRVTRRRVVGVLPPDPEQRKRRTPGPFEQAMARYMEMAKERGYAMPFTQQHEENRQKVLEGCPPPVVTHVDDQEGVFPDDMTWNDARDFMGLFDVPPEVHSEFVGLLGPLPAPRADGFRRIIEVARWDSPALLPR